LRGTLTRLQHSASPVLYDFANRDISDSFPPDRKVLQFKFNFLNMPISWMTVVAAARAACPPAAYGGGSVVQIGVDFGGTKIEAAALAAGGGFLSRRRAPNPGRYDDALEVVRQLVDKVEHEAGGRGSVGVGAPGSVSPRTGVVRNANSTWLNGRTFREDLERVLERPIRLANDANCLALSEVADGAAFGAGTCFAVILGTGCGGGVVVDGHLIEGANGVGGEWGHIPLPWPLMSEIPGPQCWCGQHGCLETWISGTGLARDFAQTNERRLDGPAIVAAARSGDAAAAAAVDRYVDRLGRALAMVCNLIDPDVFVFGGGLSNVAEIFEALPQVIQRHVFCEDWSAKLTPARWGDSSGVRGAARLWSRHTPAAEG
jgi:fructokinase